MERRVSARLQAGDAAPELRFRTRERGERLLSKIWEDGPALILWLRHLGGPFCVEGLAQVRDKKRNLRNEEWMWFAWSKRTRTTRMNCADLLG
jgi:hypothetical protein